MMLELWFSFVVIATLLVLNIRDTRKIRSDTANMAADIRDIALMMSRVSRHYDRMIDLYPIDSDR